MSEYATIAQLRADGVEDSVSDAQLLRVIQRASLMIEQWTGRFFVPRYLTLQLDGDGHDILQIGPPIIHIASVRILAPEIITLPSGADDVPLSSLRVYNRHLRQNLTEPDDRNNPKIQWMTSWDGTRLQPEIYPAGWFPRGTQNIEITGWFGYTEYDGGVTLAPVADPPPDPLPAPIPLGRTPEVIEMVCSMLVVRDLLPLADVSGRTEVLLSSTVTEERTRDQTVKYGSGGKSSIATSAGPGIANNKELQMYLEPFRRPPTLGAV